MDKTTAWALGFAIAGMVYFGGRTMGIFSFFKSSRQRALAMYERGMNKAKKENYAGAIEDYSALLKMNSAPEDVRAMALFNRGLAYSITKDIVKAREDLQAAIVLPGAPSNVVTAAREKLERIKRREHD